MSRAMNPLGRLLDPLVRAQLAGPGVPRFDFSQPTGEPALTPAEGVSWRVFANPVALFVGGVAAVILELALPAVRVGVWEHSDFRRDPVRRLRRTGLAAMATVYGARDPAAEMIAGVRRAHAGVSGRLPSGEPYRADDPELLRWVQATAVWGFARAYDAYAAPLGGAERDGMFAEGEAAARLYGVEAPPTRWAEWEALLAATEPMLEPSPVIGEFVGLMRTAPALPRALAPVQRLMVRGAVGVVPPRVRARLGLEGGPRRGERALLRGLGRLAERVEGPSSPRAQARRRLAMRGSPASG